MSHTTPPITDKNLDTSSDPLSSANPPNAPGREGTKQTILIVEDEVKIAQLLHDFLVKDGFEVALLHSGINAVETALTQPPTLLILDLMLPEKDGLTICREIRQQSDLPIIMLTARVDEIDRLLGLELGADDYICKPFSPREVVARVRAILRRLDRVALATQASVLAQSNPQHATIQSDEVIQYADIDLIPDQHHCRVGEHEVDLTPVEFRLLHAMLLAPGRVFSRQILMNTAYDDYRVVSDRTIDSHIKNIRRKLTAAHKATGLESPDLLKSIYGVGYKLD